MTREVLARRGGIGLGVTYVLLGVTETVRLVVTGDGGFFFWFGTLVGGGVLLLLGAVPRQEDRTRRHLGAILLGATIGIPATVWTIVIPLVAVTVIVLTLMSQEDGAAPTASG